MNQLINTPLVLFSACLLGEKVRYDGQSMKLLDPIITNWQNNGAIIPLCPEVSGGLSIPRKPAEIKLSEYDIIDIINVDNINVTKEFKQGAHIALQTCQKHNIKMAVLAENSPSCGSHFIYDGHFTGNKISGEGVTTSLLRENGIKVFNQHQIQQADKFYQNLRENRYE